MEQKNNLINFSFESKDIRVIMLNNDPWWPLNDVCVVLEIANSRDVADRLDNDEKNTVVLNDGIPGNPNRTVINESGLYSVIIRSDKPNAKLFKRWLTHDVIPQIRKTGSYNPLTTITPEQIAAERTKIVSEVLTEITVTLIPTIIEQCTKEIVNDASKKIESFIKPSATSEAKNSQLEFSKKITSLEREIASLKELKTNESCINEYALEEKRKEIIKISNNKRNTTLSYPTSVRFYLHDNRRSVALREYVEIEKGRKVKPSEFYDLVFDAFQEKILQT